MTRLSSTLCLCLCLCLCLAACTGDRQADALRPASGWDLLDGFESDPLWAHDSADDHAELACEPGDAIQGATALVVRARAGTRGKVLVRKEVDLDASALTGLRVAARVTAGPAPLISFALRGADGTWFESPRLTLQPGWNRDLSWDPRDLPGWAKSSPRIDRLILLVVPQGGDCSVAFDDLRGAGAWRWRSEPATLRAVVAPPAQALRYQPLELSFAITWPDAVHAAVPAEAAVGSRLLRRMVAGGAWVTAPDGERWFQPAACIGSVGDTASADMRYAVRITPDRAGTWRLEPGLDAGSGRWAWGATATCLVDAVAAGAGPVRRDPADRHWLMRADGSFIWPLGMNVAWAGDYTPWLDRLQRDGCNAVRVWMCPWNNPLDVAGDLQTVNQASASAIDGLLDGAAKRGIYVQLCLTYHGWFGADWARNPFNVANGGPIADGREFWVDGQARAGFRRLLDYVSARWGHHPALLAWELVNEVDLAPRYRDRDLIDWHREMARHLARVDRNRHLITTSVAAPGHLAELWSLGDIDLVNVHRYEADPLRAIAGVAGDVAAAGKPGWAAEAGRDWTPAGAMADPDGAYLHQALWWSWMHGLSASSWAWWWDIQVQNQDLTRHHAAIARYLAGEDPRGQAACPVSASTDGLAVAGLLAADRGWVYAADPAAVRPQSGVPVPGLARHILLTGCAPGSWSVEMWDPAAGVCVETVSIDVAVDGGMPLTLPAGRSELAWKLRRSTALRPGVSIP
jgi:hypothetical protein